MNEEFKQLETEIKWLTDIVDANLEKQYNRLKTMSNKELRKEIENANWSYILQMIRYLQAKIERLEEEYSKLEEKYFDNVPCCNENDCDLYKNYMKLKDNWNKLKEFIVKEYYMYLPLEASTKSITILIDKMAKLEQGNLIEK